MPAHGFPPRSHDRTRQKPQRSLRPRKSIVPILALLVLLSIPAALWWGVGLSWKAMTRDEGGKIHARWTLVLDGWIPQGERIAKGLDLARAGQTDSVLVSGAQIAPGLWGSTLQIRAQEIDTSLRGRVAEIRHQANSTFEEAQAATAFFRSRGVDTVLLVTSDYHTDRARSIFERVAAGRPVYLAIPAIEARFSATWDRERMKTWTLEATKRTCWWLFERWTSSPLDSSHRAIAWRSVVGDSVGLSPILHASCPAAPACPPRIECPVCPIAEPVVAPCPEIKPSKIEPKENVKNKATVAKKTVASKNKESTKAQASSKKAAPKKR